MDKFYQVYIIQCFKDSNGYDTRVTDRAYFKDKDKAIREANMLVRQHGLHPLENGSIDEKLWLVSHDSPKCWVGVQELAYND